MFSIDFALEVTIKVNTDTFWEKSVTQLLQTKNK